jgi:preprotein translocase subunit SecY
MPRSIIDTQSSRPAYIRRNVALIVLAALLAILIVYIYERQSHRHVPLNQGGAARSQAGQPGKQPMKPPGK